MVFPENFTTWKYLNMLIEDFKFFASENSANIAQCKILDLGAKTRIGVLTRFRQTYDTFLVLYRIVSLIIILQNFDIMDIMNKSRM